MQSNQEDKRAARVSLVKRLIIAAIITGILILIVLCILSFVKVERSQQVDELTVCREQEQMTAMSADESVSLESGQDIYNSTQEAKASISQNGTELVLLGENPYSDRQSREPAKQTTKVYLTFDDGPSSNTEAILDILKQYDVKAAFFVTGKPQEAYIPLYQRIVAEGHTLGMHSYSHRYNEIYASKEAFVQDLETLQEYLYDVTGVWSRFYRFPGGSSNQVSEVPMQELTDYLDSEDIYYLDWNVSGGDATGKRLRPQQIADNVTENVRKYRTAVVLLHDGADKTSTVEALPIMIETLMEMDDVEFAPVNDEMNMVQHLQIQAEDAKEQPATE